MQESPSSQHAEAAGVLEVVVLQTRLDPGAAVLPSGNQQACDENVLWIKLK